MKVFLAYFLDAAPNTFSRGRDKSAEKKEIEFDHVSQNVGLSQIQIDWLKKDRLSGMSVSEKVKCIDGNDKKLSISRQCELLQLPHSSYYRPRDCHIEDEENLGLMKLIDEELLRHPFYCSRKMKVYLSAEVFL